MCGPESISPALPEHFHTTLKFYRYLVSLMKRNQERQLSPKVREAELTGVVGPKQRESTAILET